MNDNCSLLLLCRIMLQSKQRKKILTLLEMVGMCIVIMISVVLPQNIIYVGCQSVQSL